MIPALGRQRNADLYEFVVYKASCRTVRESYTDKLGEGEKGRSHLPKVIFSDRP